jgi:hypothetical protein
LLNEYLRLCLAQLGGVLVLVGFLLIDVSDFRFAAGFFEKVNGSNFIATKTHAERWSDLLEWNSIFLCENFRYLTALKMVDFNWLSYASASEDNNSLELSDVGLLHILNPEEVYRAKIKG